MPAPSCEKGRNSVEQAFELKKKYIVMAGSIPALTGER
jgi:hypothetical protein